MIKVVNLVSYTFLFSTSLYCTIRYSLEAIDRKYFLYGNFIIAAAYACFGAAKSAFNDLEDKLRTKYNIVFSVSMVALPCTVIEICLKNEVLGKIIVALFLLVNLAFVIVRICTTIEDDIVDTIIGINVVTLLGISLIAADFYAALCALSFIMGHYGSPHSEDLGYSTSSEDVYNFCLVGFIYFAYASTTSVIK